MSALFVFFYFSLLLLVCLFVFENSFACVRLCGYDLRGSSSVVVAISVQVRALCVSCASLLFCEIGYFFWFLVNEWPGGKSVSLLVFGAKCVTLMKSAASVQLVLICTFVVTSCSGCGTLWTVLFEQHRF